MSVRAHAPKSNAPSGARTYDRKKIAELLCCNISTVKRMTFIPGEVRRGPRLVRYIADVVDRWIAAGFPDEQEWARIERRGK